MVSQKVLIITYYWPPAGGPGVQRWLKFIKYLNEFDIEPIVFVPDNPHYPLQDDSLLNDIPKGIEIIRQPIFEPYGIASFFSRKKTKRISSGMIKTHKKQSILERFLLWIRGNFFIPDARKFWVKPSVARLKTFIKNRDIQTVITTGPPHSVHLIGKALKKEVGIRWLADFRDPWTSIGYHKKLKLTKAAQKKHKHLEKAVLNAADTLIVTSETTKKEFEYSTAKPIAVITNGFDKIPPEVAIDSCFSIAHIGSLLTERNPENLWKALAELVIENTAFASNLIIRLIGAVSEEVSESLSKHGLTEYVEFLGYRSHKEVVKYQAKSQLLLLLEIDSAETQGIIPGKLFEYLNVNRPILAVGPKDWEAGQMIENHQAGDYVVQHDLKTIKNVILKRFEQFQLGELVCDAIHVEQYHRRNLTQQLAKILAWESS